MTRRSEKGVPTGNPPCCACGCGDKTLWDGNRKAYNKFIQFHHNKNGKPRYMRHGHSPKSKTAKGANATKEYMAWHAMINRCTNEKDSSWPRYGGRGITVCDSWLKSFIDFYLYIGPAPSRKHTLDRIDNDGNYEPGNIRWATEEEQCNNKSNSKRISHLGETLTVAQWSRKLGIKEGTINNRLRKGWPAAKALSTNDLRRFGWNV